MRAVLDNNVAVSGLITPGGKPGQALDAMRAGAYQNVSSSALLAELEAGLRYPRVTKATRMSEPQRLAFLEWMRARSEHVEPTMTITICRDDDDNRVLEAAVAGHADYIVTGDKDLLVLDEYEGIRIVTAAEFVDVLERERSS